jgi:hypothetical protein
MADGAGVSGGWRRPSRGGGVTLARAVTLASLGVAALYGYHSMRDR